MLTSDVRELTLPMNSSMIFGLLPAAVIRVAVEMSVGIATRRYGISLPIATVNQSSSHSYS